MADPAPFNVADIKRRMAGAVDALKHDFGGLRTGRASTALLDPIQVDAYGANMPLNQVASVSVPEARLLQISVWDRGMVAAVEKAIHASNLGLNPQTEGSVIRLRMPDLTQDRRKELVKVAHQYAEKAKVAARNVRRDGMDQLKVLEKAKLMSEDDHKTKADEIQKMTDDTVKDIDGALKLKEAEIMQV
jgi:ribosome recycling factor